MDIFVVCDYQINPNRIGGMDRFFKAFDEKVKKNGHQITWLFSYIAPHDFYNDINMISANGVDVLQKTTQLLEAKEVQVDILITHFVTQFESPFKTFKVKYGIPSIICVDHNPRPLNGFNLKKRIKKRIKGFLNHQYIDKVIGVSDYTSNHSIQDFGKITASKTTTIYNGIDTTVFNNKKTLNSKKDFFNFIVVSHLRKSKGIQDLLQAISILSEEEKSKFNIDIFGTGPFEKELKQMTKSYGLTKSITFKGSSPDIHLNLYRYDYMLQPTHMECFSLSILESLLSNVPVITTYVGGNAEVVEHNVNGWLYEATDVNALHQIMKCVLNGEYAIESNVYSKIESTFTLNKMVDNHLKLITCI